MPDKNNKIWACSEREEVFLVKKPYKKRKIILVSYEHMAELLGLDKDEFISDIISTSRERCSEKVLIKVVGGKEYSIPESEEILRINSRDRSWP